MALRNHPHPEEAAKRLSRRTHNADPAMVDFLTASEAGIQGFQSLAPCSCQGQALGPRFRGGDEGGGRRILSQALGLS